MGRETDDDDDDTTKKHIYGPLISLILGVALCIDTDSFLALIKGSIDTSLSDSRRMMAKSTRSIDAWLWRRTTKARCDQATAICSENETTAEAIHAVVPLKQKEKLA